MCDKPKSEEFPLIKGIKGPPVDLGDTEIVWLSAVTTRKGRVLELVDNVDAAADWIVSLQGDIAELKGLNRDLLAACKLAREVLRSRPAIGAKATSDFDAKARAANVAAIDVIVKTEGWEP